jgi:hypothetical protein
MGACSTTETECACILCLSCPLATHVHLLGQVQASHKDSISHVSTAVQVPPLTTGCQPTSPGELKESPNRPSPLFASDVRARELPKVHRNNQTRTVPQIMTYAHNQSAAVTCLVFAHARACTCVHDALDAMPFECAVPDTRRSVHEHHALATWMHMDFHEQITRNRFHACRRRSAGT